MGVRAMQAWLQMPIGVFDERSVEPLRLSQPKASLAWRSSKDYVGERFHLFAHRFEGTVFLEPRGAVV